MNLGWVNLPLALTIASIKASLVVLYFMNLRHDHDHLVVHAGLVPGVPLDDQEPEHLLNLRSITPEGRPSKKLDGTPWAALWRGPDHVVFGHDAVRGLQRHPHATGLDTGCVYGNALTALVLEAGADPRLVSVQARRAYARMTG